MDAHNHDKFVYRGLSLDLLNALKQLNLKPPFTGFDNLIEMTRALKNDSMIESIFKGIEDRMKFTQNTSDLATALSTQAKAVQFATSGISKSLFELSKSQRLISDKIIRTLNIQTALSNSLIELSKSLQPKVYPNFSALSSILESYSRFHLDLTAESKNWADLDVFRKSAMNIKEITDSLISQTSAVTFEDLNVLKTEIINELSSAANKTKNQKLINFIFKIIAIISLLLQLYPIDFKKKDISNREVIEYTEQDLNALKSEIRDIVKQELKELQTTTEIISDVNLRKSPTIKSMSLAIVKKGQEVFILENRSKWAFVAYIDKETGSTKSGYIYNTYLKNNKSKK